MAALKDSAKKRPTKSDELSSIVDNVIADYPKKILEYRAGIRPAMTFLITETIKRTGGKADADKVRKAIIDKL
jgi:Asp-tRNA(Asn)/Glu-tRNA(Gln) amidotransferase B subunit